MRKVLLILILALLLGVSSIPASASSRLFRPDSKLYFMQSAWESVRLFFTFSKTAKVNYLIQLADRRTSEMGLASSAKIAERYVNHFKELEKIAGQTENREEIAEKIKEASLRQQEALSNVYNKVPDEAKDAILNAQENSSKNVARTVEAIQGQEMAQEYVQKVEQIQQAEKIERQQRLEQVPMEGSPQVNPSESVPNELNPPNPANPLNPGKELNPLNPIFENDNQGQGGGQMEPVSPAPMEPSMPQN